MNIKVVNLQIVDRYEITIEAKNEYVYGVGDAAPVFCSMIGKLNIEVLALLCLDNANKIINYSTVAMGEINKVRVPLAQILKIALISNSSSIVIAHNHPSGVLEITNSDIEMTRRIGRALNFFDIQLLDSLVVNDTNAVSIRGNLENIDD